MSQLLKSTEPAKTDQKAPGFSGNADIEAAMARAQAALDRQEAENARKAQQAEREAKEQADENARYRASRTKSSGPIDHRKGFCSC